MDILRIKEYIEIGKDLINDPILSNSDIGSFFKIYCIFVEIIKIRIKEDLYFKIDKDLIKSMNLTNSELGLLIKILGNREDYIPSHTDATDLLSLAQKKYIHISIGKFFSWT